MEFQYYKVRYQNKGIRIQLPSQPIGDKEGFRAIDDENNNIVVDRKELESMRQITESEFYKLKKES
jgi:hypothetical protein